MKVALVHDYLTEYGGAERVLEAIHELWPEAPVYTSLFDEEKFENLGEVRGFKRFKGYKGSEGLTKLAKAFTFFMPLVFENMDLRGYDVVISDGTIWSKGVLTNPTQLHIHYCHTPPRWLYGYPGETDRRRLWYLQPILKPLDNWLRIWDFESAQRPDFVVANSKTVAGRVKKFWRREARVIYPPVRTASENSENGSEQLRKLSESERQGVRESENQRIGNSDVSDTPTHRRADAPSYSEFSGNLYFLIVSRLSAYKNIDVAIEACSQLKLPLVVVGTGREEERLKAIAGDTVKFMNFVEDSELSKLYKDCQALIFPVSNEDFGIVPVEAMSFGKPIIALRSGGVQETVVEGKTGVFFNEPTVESLVGAIERFEGGLKGAKGVKENCVGQAGRFSKERFQKEFKEFVESRWREGFKRSKGFKGQ